MHKQRVHHLFLFLLRFKTFSYFINVSAFSYNFRSIRAHLHMAKNLSTKSRRSVNEVSAKSQRSVNEVSAKDFSSPAKFFI